MNTEIQELLKIMTETLNGPDGVKFVVYSYITAVLLLMLGTEFQLCMIIGITVAIFSFLASALILAA